jgi:hypothetical protein
LYLLESVLVAAPSSAFVNAANEQNVLNAYTDLLLKRADVDSSGASNSLDMAELYGHFGVPGDPTDLWTMDLNVDGEVNEGDVATMITELFRTEFGDFNLDGHVDAADYVVWRRNEGATNALYIEGDADLDGDVDDGDFAMWRGEFGFARQMLSGGSGSGAGSGAVPEPGALPLCLVLACSLAAFRRIDRTRI